MTVNLRAPFFCAQAVAGAMIERRSGKIINIASDAGIVAYPGHAAYGATKGGLIHLTRILAVEWGPHNVQVNAICPGATWSDMTTPAMQQPEIASQNPRPRRRRPHHRARGDRRRRGLPRLGSVEHDHGHRIGRRGRLDREIGD